MKDVLTTGQNIRRLTTVIDELNRPLEILEAGCGRQWLLKLKVPYRLTGVDLDGDALKARIDHMHDLHVGIVGDLCTVDLPAASFDVVYCSWVLEHIQQAPQVLDNFAKWVKPGGLVVVRVPDRDTLFGFFTRMTPHWAHVWFYRWFWGYKTAGTPGHGPYPTYYDFSISQNGMEQFCARAGLRLLETHRVDSWIKQNRARALLTRCLAALTLGLLPWRWNALTFVVQKPA
jgi:SAM-dependent methyltransferase